VADVAQPKSDGPLEASILDSAVPLEAILRTEELYRRPSRPPDYEKENRALVALVSALADSPRSILQTLAEGVLEVLQADSAGVSLLTKDEKSFYWAAIAGAWQPHIGGGTSRDFGPCGDVLDRNIPMLFTHWERRYPYLHPATPLAEEGLLVPFYVNGKAVGTIWAIAHTNHRNFDTEDLRLLESLSRFASAAYQALASIDDLKFQVAAREKAEAALQKLAKGLEAKVRRLVEANIIGIVSWNLEGEIIEANDAFLRMVGYDREDLPTGLVSWRELTPDEWQASNEQALAELATTGICEPFEKEFFRKDGSRVPILVGAALFEGSKNEGIAFVLDLSEQKRSEQALRRSEYYLAEVQRLSHTGSWAFNIATREIVHLSQEHFRIFGFDPKEGMPSFETLFQRIHPNDRAEAIEVIERGIRDRTDYEQDFRIVLPDRTMRSMHATGHPIAKSSGDPVEFVGIVIDVTERKRVEEELRRSEAYLTEAQRLSRTGSWAWNLSTGEVLWSREIYRIFGLDPDQTSLDIELIKKLRHPEDRPLAARTLDNAVRETKDFEFESRIVLPDGSIKHVRSVGRPVVNDAAVLVEFVGAVMDVTEGKMREEALRKSQAELAHVARVATLGEMSASIAHEVNQPLTAAATSASACLRWLDAQKLEEARRSASRVIAEVHRASEIIGHIRSLTRKAPPQKDWLDINETIHEVIALARSEIQRNSIALETELSEHVPVILADRVQLQQVILNLVMNAIEAMSGLSDGPRELLIRSGTDESEQVVISVQDSGPGFDPGSLDHLFEAFYTTKPQGLGMGLAISRSIVESHGGRLWATVNAPCGAVFRFRLPVGKG
jgi:PAS domain S-box-containing protein